ncbi:MAG: RidA family protein [Gemmatimonadota bacterium]
MTTVSRLRSTLLRRLPVAGLLSAVLSGCTPPASARQAGPRPDFMENLEEKRFISVPGVAKVEGFSQAIKIGKQIYLSGQVPLDSAGHLVGNDLSAQAAQVFQNLRAVLLAAGATPEDVIRFDVQIVGLKPGDLARIQQADTAFFPRGRGPVGSLAGVESLPVPGALLAVNALAETRGLFPDRQQLQRYR